MWISILGCLILQSSFLSLETAHVVFLHHLSSYSHIVASTPLAEALVQRDHKVTYIAAVPPSSPNPNITHITPEGLQKFFKDVIDKDFDIKTRLEGRTPNLLLYLDYLNLKTCEALIKSKDFQTWMSTTTKVDLIYVDSIPECAYGIAYKLKAKLAIFLPIPMNPRYFDAFGIPAESSSNPTWALNLKTPLSFFDRVLNTLNPIGWRLSQILYWEALKSIFKEHLDTEYLPGLDEFNQNVSIILSNGHFMEEQRRSLPPFFVNVPGLHVREKLNPLSKEIAEFVNSTDQDGKPSEGFIYISFGTVVKSENIPQNIQEIFFNTITSFPNIRFLWKWNGELPKVNNPKNLYLSKWFNQQDLLGSSSIRGFITQTGRPSSQEAISNGVPFITFPVIGDQDYNANMLEGLGVSISLDIGDVTEEKLNKAIDSILYDKKIKERSVQVSKLYKDLPMKPIDLAVWWTEYVLRHNDTRHLKPLAINQTWYQRRLLDVWAFLTIISFLFLYLMALIFRFCFNITIRQIFSPKGKLKNQ